MIIIPLIIVLFVVCALIVSDRVDEEYEEWKKSEGWKFHDEED